MLVTFRCLLCRVRPNWGKRVDTAHRRFLSYKYSSVSRLSSFLFIFCVPFIWVLCRLLDPVSWPFARTSTHIWERSHLCDDRFHWPNFHAVYLIETCSSRFCSWSVPFDGAHRSLSFASFICAFSSHSSSSTFSLFSLSVLQFSHGWPSTPRSISATIVLHAISSHRHCHDKGASMMKPAQNYRLCVKTHRINASHHLERVSYCVVDEWMTWCCC